MEKFNNYENCLQLGKDECLSALYRVKFADQFSVHFPLNFASNFEHVFTIKQDTFDERKIGLL